MSLVRKLHPGGSINQDALNTALNNEISSYNLKSKDERKVREALVNMRDYLKDSSGKSFTIDPVGQTFKITGQGSEKFTGSPDEIKSNWFTGNLRLKDQEDYNTVAASIYGKALKSLQGVSDNSTSIPSSNLEVADTKTQIGIHDLGKGAEELYGTSSNLERVLARADTDELRKKEVYKVANATINSYIQNAEKNKDIAEYTDLSKLDNLRAAIAKEDWPTFVSEAYKFKWEPENWLLDKGIPAKTITTKRGITLNPELNKKNLLSAGLSDNLAENFQNYEIDNNFLSQDYWEKLGIPWMAKKLEGKIALIDPNTAKHIVLDPSTQNYYQQKPEDGLDPNQPDFKYTWGMNSGLTNFQWVTPNLTPQQIEEEKIKVSPIPKKVDWEIRLNNARLPIVNSIKTDKSNFKSLEDAQSYMNDLLTKSSNIPPRNFIIEVAKAIGGIRYWAEKTPTLTEQDRVNVANNLIKYDKELQNYTKPYANLELKDLLGEHYRDPNKINFSEDVWKYGKLGKLKSYESKYLLPSHQKGGSLSQVIRGEEPGTSVSKVKFPTNTEGTLRGTWNGIKSGNAENLWEGASLLGQVASFIPGIGVIGGLVTTASDIGKDVAKDGFQLSDIINLNTAANIGFTALSGIGLGSLRALRLAKGLDEVTKGVVDISKLANKASALEKSVGVGTKYTDALNDIKKVADIGSDGVLDLNKVTSNINKITDTTEKEKLLESLNIVKNLKEAPRVSKATEPILRGIENAAVNTGKWITSPTVSTGAMKVIKKAALVPTVFGVGKSSINIGSDLASGKNVADTKTEDWKNIIGGLSLAHNWYKNTNYSKALNQVEGGSTHNNTQEIFIKGNEKPVGTITSNIKNTLNYTEPTIPSEKLGKVKKFFRSAERQKARTEEQKKSLVAAKESAEDEFKTNLGKIFNEQNPSNQLTKEQIKNIDISKLNTTLNTSFNPATLRKSPLVGEDNDVQKAYYDWKKAEKMLKNNIKSYGKLSSRHFFKVGGKISRYGGGTSEEGVLRIDTPVMDFQNPSSTTSTWPYTKTRAITDPKFGLIVNNGQYTPEYKNWILSRTPEWFEKNKEFFYSRVYQLSGNKKEVPFSDIQGTESKPGLAWDNLYGPHHQAALELYLKEHPEVGKKNGNETESDGVDNNFKGGDLGIKTIPNWWDRNKKYMPDATDLSNLLIYSNTYNANVHAGNDARKAIVDGLYKLPYLNHQYIRIDKPYSLYGEQQASDISGKVNKMANSTSDLNKSFLVKLSGADQARSILDKANTMDQQRVDQLRSSQLESNYKIDDANTQTLGKNRALSANAFKNIQILNRDQRLAQSTAFNNFVLSEAHNIPIRQQRELRGELYNAYQDKNYLNAKKAYSDIVGNAGKNFYYNQWLDKKKRLGDDYKEEFENSIYQTAWDKAKENKAADLENASRKITELTTLYQMNLPSYYGIYKKGGSLSKEEKIEINKEKANSESKIKNDEMIYKLMMHNNEMLQKALINVFK